MVIYKLRLLLEVFDNNNIQSYQDRIYLGQKKGNKVMRESSKSMKWKLFASRLKILYILGKKKQNKK